MDPTTIVALALLFALGAALYSSVGHGGASAYIAAMALFSVAPETMKPTALALNLLVAGFGAWRYWRRGLTNGKLVLAFALTATPAAFIGGGIHVPANITSPGRHLLWLAAARLLWQPKGLAYREVRAPALWVTLPAGAVLGLLAGLTGTGGGIFLSPLIILMAGRSRAIRRASFRPSSSSTPLRAWPETPRRSGTAPRIAHLPRLGRRRRPSRDLARRRAAAASLAASDARPCPHHRRREAAVHMKATSRW